MTRKEVIDSFVDHWDEDSKCQPEYFNDDDLGFIKRSINERISGSSNYKINNPQLSKDGYSLSFDLSVDDKLTEGVSYILKSYYKNREY